MRPFRSLDAQKVIETIAALERRISERFPNAGLRRVCAELLTIARESSQRALAIGQSNTPLRLLVFVFLAASLWLLAWIASLIDFTRTSADSVYSVLQGIEAAANLAVLMGAALFFLFRIEERVKRRRALRALHELRSIVHVIDMHQLTKDPSGSVSIGGSTLSSPARTLSRFELSRYLDYCSEMLSLTSKVAVLYAQSFPDTEVTDAVSDIERIAAGLSQKVWQKIMILQSAGIDTTRAAPAPSAASAAVMPAAARPRAEPR
jgi:hypothetical protein